MSVVDTTPAEEERCDVRTSYNIPRLFQRTRVTLLSKGSNHRVLGPRVPSCCSKRPNHALGQLVLADAKRSRMQHASATNFFIANLLYCCRRRSGGYSSVSMVRSKQVRPRVCSQFSYRSEERYGCFTVVLLTLGFAKVAHNLKEAPVPGMYS